MLDVQESRELQAVLLTLRDLDKTVRSNINKETRSRVNTVWQQAVASRAHTSLERAVIGNGVRVAVGQRNVTLRAAGSNRALRPQKNGLVPSIDWPAVELGMHRGKVRYRSRSPKGTPYVLTRTIGTAFKGRRSRGYVAFPAGAETGVEIVTMWVHTIVDVLKANAAVDVTGAR
jgi:hypothetical protein